MEQETKSQEDQSMTSASLDLITFFTLFLVGILFGIFLYFLLMYISPSLAIPVGAGVEEMKDIVFNISLAGGGLVSIFLYTIFVYMELLANKLLDRHQGK